MNISAFFTALTYGLKCSDLPSRCLPRSISSTAPRPLTPTYAKSKSGTPPPNSAHTTHFSHFGTPMAGIQWQILPPQSSCVNLNIRNSASNINALGFKNLPPACIIWGTSLLFQLGFLSLLSMGVNARKMIVELVACLALTSCRNTTL